jgi:hypothetical protein
MAGSLIAANGTAFTHQHRSQTVGTAGERIFSWTTAGTFTGFVQAVGSGLTEEFNRRELTITHRIYTTTILAVHEGDRLVSADSREYVVRGSVDQAGLGRVLRLDVTEVLSEENVAEASSSDSSESSSSVSSESSSSHSGN